MSFSDRMRWWRRKRSGGKVNSMRHNWCKAFESGCPSVTGECWKYSLELILSSTTNRLLREGMSLPFMTSLIGSGADPGL